jgi:hypothetical protein
MRLREIALMLYGLLAEGGIVLLFWGWFAEPLGLPPISYGHAIGLTCLVTFMSIFFRDSLKKLGDPTDESEMTDEEVKRAAYGMTELYVSTLIVGSVAYALM